MNYGHHSLAGTKYVLHYKFNDMFSTPNFEKTEEFRTPMLVEGMEMGIILKVPTIFVFFGRKLMQWMILNSKKWRIMAYPRR
jgi:hypothetical protein